MILIELHVPEAPAEPLESPDLEFAFFPATDKSGPHYKFDADESDDPNSEVTAPTALRGLTFDHVAITVSLDHLNDGEYILRADGGVHVTVESFPLEEGGWQITARITAPTLNTAVVVVRELATRANTPVDIGAYATPAAQGEGLRADVLAEMTGALPADQEE